MTIQDQYAKTVRKSQENGADVMDSITKSLKKVFGVAVTPFVFRDPNAAIDQVFDFWTRTLEVQRDLTKKMAGVSVAISESVRNQAETLGESVVNKAEKVSNSVANKAEKVSDTVKATVESTKDAVQDAAAKKYEELTKVELQDELARRDLPKTGNVDELRDRLVEDDRK